MMTSENNKKAFTLIELLVVISIIALLMSILMPSLQAAREQAKKVICKSNERQQGLAMMMYSSENNNFFAPTHAQWHFDNSGDHVNYSVFEVLESYGPPQPGQDVRKPKGIWICPSDKPAQGYPDTFPPPTGHSWQYIYYNYRLNTYEYVSYAYSVADSGWQFDVGYGLYSLDQRGTNNKYMRKVSEVHQPARRMMFICGSRTRRMTYWNYDIHCALPVEPFHKGLGNKKGAVNLLAVDGHVETFDDFAPTKGYYTAYGKWCMPEYCYKIK